MAFEPTVKELFEGIKAGNKIFLGRAITLIESAKKTDHDRAIELLSLCHPLSGNSLRIAITGSPGSGKSTLIESLGNLLIARGHKIAVLAVDPSSKESGGSILGDKTRMETLTQASNAFIRPSPNNLELGGIKSNTRESIILCEAAGFDLVILETVGVGQSEIEVSHMSDLVLLLLTPAGGDDLQGIKKGIMETADIIAINKADGALMKEAQNTRYSVQQSLKHGNRRDQVEIIQISALQKTNLEHLADSILIQFELLKETGMLSKHRAEQNDIWFDSALKQAVINKIYDDENFKRQLEVIKSEKDKQQIPAPILVQQFMAKWKF